MGLVPLRLVLMISGGLVAALFVLGIFHYNPKRYACMSGAGFYGEWRVLFAVSKLEIRNREWGCDEIDRYDPRTAQPAVAIPENASREWTQ